MPEDCESKDQHQVSSGGIAGTFSRVKHFFRDAPRMPSNRTAAVAYGDKLKNPKYNPATAPSHGPESGLVLKGREVGSLKREQSR